MKLLSTLERFFRGGRSSRGGVESRPRSQRLLVAFSGGPDSTALLWGLRQIAEPANLELLAAHLDHGLDPDSRRRATAAQRLARQIGVPLTCERAPGSPGRPGESLESCARRLRYEFLNRHAERHQAPVIVTAHHAEDQAETVLLRLLFGSGLDGLVAIRPWRDRLARPLLSLRRHELVQALADTGLEPVVDPTNADLEVPRNRVRHLLLPALETSYPDIVETLGDLAQAAAGAQRRTRELLTPKLGPRPCDGGAEIDRKAFEALATPLIPSALALLSQHAGASYPAPATARAELLRQFEGPGRIGCDCGGGWRWEGDRRRLRLRRRAPETAEFSYRLEVPGRIEIPELGLGFGLRQGPVEPWMFRGEANRAGLALALAPGASVTIRNRRPGDRIQPLGVRGTARLKDLLIDRGVGRSQRNRLPLLVVDGDIAWVPGVTIADRLRLNEEKTTWIAEIEPTQS